MKQLAVMKLSIDARVEVALGAQPGLLPVDDWKKPFASLVEIVAS